MRRLMTRFGTREDKVDTLLRCGVFVDLYRIIRQGLLLGASDYSLKTVEKLYKEQRGGGVTTAAGSIVFYARWLESDQSQDWQQSSILKDIRDYNEEDCVSTWQLADWLRNKQLEHGVRCEVQADGAEGDTDKEEEVLPTAPDALARHQLAMDLLAGIPVEAAECEDNPERWQLQEMLGYLLEFHRRDAKPMWWALFERHQMREEELVDELSCLGGLKQTDDPPEPIKRSMGFWYSFNADQDTRLRKSNIVYFAHDLDIKARIEEFDPDGRIQLKLGPAALSTLPEGDMPYRLSLIPDEFVSAKVIETAIGDVVQTWCDDEFLPIAFQRFLLRQPPRMKGREQGGALIQGDADNVAECVRIVRDMEDSAFCIQGPPGTGKTYTASRMIAALLQDGKTIGVTSNSHKAILNILEACHDATDGKIVALKAGGAKDDPILEACPEIQWASSNTKASDAFEGGIIGGTAWLFARSDFEDRLDYLFVDEAGQVSVANLAGMSRSTRNIVLIGDQMQLSQPTQGTHPGESGLSILEYLLLDHAVVPEELGVFLDCTRRMHPNICEFISESVYEGRLHAHDSTVHRTVPVPTGEGRLVTVPAGLVFSPVEHFGNTQSSDEEVARIVEITQEILGRPRTDCNGIIIGEITLNDILYVAPYNMQVRKLSEALPEGARVGSVDKFQGQEAAIVIVSMCCSNGEFGSRGIEFVLNKNRLNVAISRAQSLAIIVADPGLASTSTRNIADMERVNLFCRLLHQTA